MTNKKISTECFSIKLEHSDNLIPLSLDTLASQLFSSLVEVSGLEHEDICLVDSKGKTICAFPKSEKPENEIVQEQTDISGGDYAIISDVSVSHKDKLSKVVSSFSELLNVAGNNEKYHELITRGFDVLPNQICVYDKNFNFLYGNKSFFDYINVKDIKSAIGRNVEEVLKDNGTVIKSINNSSKLKARDVLKYSRPAIDWEVEVSYNDKSRPPILASNDMYPLIDSNGSTVGVSEISRSRSKELKQIRKVLGLNAGYSFDDILGKSQAILNTKQRAMSFASSSYNILIYGESGVGKELFAQSIHNHSPRRNAPFVDINCASIAPELIDSELFGYESGAFTGASKSGHVGKFELANGGTLFLDEIEELPLAFQTKLLRVLETGQIVRVGGTKNIPVDVRIISATNRPLESLLEEGIFRNDLYYRLVVLNLSIPPVRERKEDVQVYAEFFLNRALESNNLPKKKISPEALKMMLEYDWPGNTREIKNIMNRLSILSSSTNISPEDFTSSIQHKNGRIRPESSLSPEARIRDRRSAVDQSYVELIREALDISGGNKTEASQLLGITRRTFYNMLEKYHDLLEEI